MGTSRKSAIKRLEGLRVQVEAHLGKMEALPNDPAVGHWRAEIRGWLAQMTDSLRHVGSRTAEDWEALLSDWAARLGDEQ